MLSVLDGGLHSNRKWVLSFGSFRHRSETLREPPLATDLLAVRRLKYALADLVGASAFIACRVDCRNREVVCRPRLQACRLVCDGPSWYRCQGGSIDAGHC